MKRVLFVLVFCTSLYILYLQGLSWPLETKKSNQLLYLCQKEAQTLDPAQAQDYFSARIIANIYEGLVKFKPGTVEVEPCLATGWEISPDGLRWIFKLRSGVTFHDGTPFNADTVKLSIDRQLNKKETRNTAALFLGMIESVQVIDQLTVCFHLRFPYTPFLNNLALPFAAPITNPGAVKESGSDLARHPVGTGPYSLEKWEPGREIILKANSAYWGEKPATSKIIFRVESKPAKRTHLILNGKADLSDVTPEDIPLLAKKGIKIWRAPGADISYLGFYTNKKPFQNPQVRYAASQAINQPQLIQELFGENVISASGPLPPGIIGYAQELQQPPYNPRQAHQLLAAAGYPDGLKITIITYAETRPYNPAGGEKLAWILAKQLAGAGFQARIIAYPWEEFKKALLRQEGDAFLYGWTGENGDPDNFLYTLFSSAQITNGLNATHYHNQKIDTLLITAQRTLAPALRSRLYQDVQKQLLQDMPAFFINHSLFLVAAAPDIQGITIRPGGYFYFSVVKKD
jgi:peptide/nickel transport system substrate-binding protein